MGVAVNVTLVPAQIAPAGFAAIVTEGTTAGFTIITIAVEIPVVGETQVELEVIITVTASPLFKVVVVNVAPPAPAFTPFTCH